MLKECSLKAQMVLGNGFGQGIAKNKQNKFFCFFYAYADFIMINTVFDWTNCMII